MKKTNKYNGMIYGMCIGVGVGTALGVVFNHTILGLAIGLLEIYSGSGTNVKVS